VDGNKTKALIILCPVNFTFLSSQTSLLPLLINTYIYETQSTCLGNDMCQFAKQRFCPIQLFRSKWSYIEFWRM